MALKFSVVIPLFKVEDYIQDLLDSFSIQTPGQYAIEYIFVDDGSPDRSGDIVQDWIDRSDLDAVLIRQTNQGVSAARNLGIAKATGDWITFPDSDDFLDRTYFMNVAKMLQSKKSSKVAIVATNIIRYFDANHRYKNSHALRFKFAAGNAVIDLEQNPNFIQLSAPTTFFRLATLRAKNISFKIGLHASEDALFTSEVLLEEKSPSMAVVSDSRYFYRKRATADSAVDTFAKNPTTYFDRFREGYLPLLREAINVRGEVPGWLVSLVLYEYRWLFSYERNVKLRASVLSDEQRQEFISLTREILAFVTPQQIEDFRVTGIPLEARQVIKALAGQEFPEHGARIDRIDPERSLAKVVYQFTGDVPNEKFYSGKKELFPVASKTQKLDYFGQTILKQRVIWVPLAKQISVQLGEEFAPLSFRFPPLQRFTLTQQEIFSASGLSTAASQTVVWPKPRGFSKIKYALTPMGLERPRDVLERALRSAGRKVRKAQKAVAAKTTRKKISRTRSEISKSIKSPEFRDTFANGWLLMDRVDAAGDNAEHLYRYLSTHRQDVNAWFVLLKGSKDWARLEKEGFRLIEYGSSEFQVALRLADHVISSHADVEMIQPMPTDLYPRGRRPWKFTFLQHGVTKDDLSIWLNPKPIDLIIAASHAEYESFVADLTPYTFTDLEVKLTGFPRYDALFNLESARDTDAKYILLSPTWRHNLVAPKVVGTGERRPADAFFESAFYKSWIGLLSDERLFEFAEANDLTVCLLPHPNLEAALSMRQLDPRVKMLSYRDGNVQEIFSKTAQLITDYSSIAFDMAFMGASVHYFQFDSEDIFAGGHTMSRGYYDYENDGFGPVHFDLESLLDGGVASIQSTFDTKPAAYVARVRSTFAYKDSGASERVVHEIEALRNDIP